MPREFSRKLRVNTQLQQVLATLIRSELRDPRVAGVTVTGADVAKDLRHAKVRVSVLGSDEDLAAAVQVLNRAAGRLRHGVGRVLSLRYLPELHFQADEELRTGDRLGALIRTAVREDDVHARTRGDDAPAAEPDAE